MDMGCELALDIKKTNPFLPSKIRSCRRKDRVLFWLRIALIRIHWQWISVPRSRSPASQVFSSAQSRIDFFYGRPPFVTSCQKRAAYSCCELVPYNGACTQASMATQRLCTVHTSLLPYFRPVCSQMNFALHWKSVVVISKSLGKPTWLILTCITRRRFWSAGARHFGKRHPV